MKINNNPVLLAAVALLSMPGLADAATIVYQDNFDNDGLATNTGIGGGLFAYDRQGGPWLDNGVLDSNRNGNNDRGNAISINAFDLTGGFTLEVTYEIDDVTTTDANRAIIGLIDSTDVPATQTNTTYITDFLNRDLNMYGIGLNLTVQNATQGLNFADGTDLVGLSNAQTISTGTHTCVLTVDSDSNWSYSIDGAPATTGAVPGGFNFATDYQFVTFMQDNHNHLKIDSVTLTAVPEPAALSLLGLAGLALTLMRRRTRA